ncbi:helix-turn-helix transcriptional regulator [Streptomyces mirabilis]
MTGTDENELLDAKRIHEEFGLSPSRLSELYRDRGTTGCPEPDEVKGRQRRWKRARIGSFLVAYRNAKTSQSGVRQSLLEGPRDRLLSTSEVAKALGHKRTVTLLGWLQDKPGYFPEPDVVEETEGGRKRRQWQLGTILDWISQRPGPGNTESKTRTQTAAPAENGDPEDLLDTKQAAPILGYSSHLELNRAIARGILPELADPDEAVRNERGITSNRYKRRRVVDLARARHEAPSSTELAQRRLAAALDAQRTAADPNLVTVEALAQAHPGHGSATAWRKSIDEARRALTQAD